MTITATTNLSLPLITPATESGVWGDEINNGLTSYLDIAIAGGLSIAITVADVTLANTAGTSSSTAITSTSAQYAILNISGAKTAARNLNLPVTSKWYVINNAGTSTGGPWTLTVRGVTPTTGVSFADGERAIIAWNGTDYAKITSSIVSNLTGTLGVANGGTGLTAGTSGGVPYYSAAGTLASSAALAASAIVLGGGAGATPATTTTGTGVVTALGVNTGSAGAFVVNGGALGTPTSGVATNLTGLPVSTGISGLGTGVATFLATPSSANLASAVTDETGSGALVFANGPTLIAPALGTPASGVATNLTGLPLSTGVTGTMPVANGGTGSATLTANSVLLGNGTSAVQVVAPSTSGNVLTSNGTTWASTALAALGVGQTWTDVTASRTLGTTYTNSTGKPIMVSVCYPLGNCVVVVGGVTISDTSAANNDTKTQNSFVVPASATYVVTAGTLTLWAELR